METWKQSVLMKESSGNTMETGWKHMETMETECRNEGIEWKHDGNRIETDRNDGNRACK